MLLKQENKHPCHSDFIGLEDVLLLSLDVIFYSKIFPHTTLNDIYMNILSETKMYN